MSLFGSSVSPGQVGPIKQVEHITGKIPVSDTFSDITLSGTFDTTKTVISIGMSGQTALDPDFMLAYGEMVNSNTLRLIRNQSGTFGTASIAIQVIELQALKSLQQLLVDTDSSNPNGSDGSFTGPSGTARKYWDTIISPVDLEKAIIFDAGNIRSGGSSISRIETANVLFSSTRVRSYSQTDDGGIRKFYVAEFI